MDPDRRLQAISLVTIVLLAGLGILALTSRQTYFVDALIFIALSAALLVLRKRLVFSWEGLMLSSAGMVMNTAGVLGAYDLSAHGVGWDKFLHIVTSAGIAMLVYGYLAQKSKGGQPVFAAPMLALIAFFIATGMGGLNEMTEFIGARYFGFSYGILGMANGSVALQNDLDRFDTQWDLIANSTGALLGIGYCWLRLAAAKGTRRARRR